MVTARRCPLPLLVLLALTLAPPCRAGGVRLVRDIEQGPRDGGTYYHELGVAGTTLFLSAMHGTSGGELWASDEGGENPRFVADLNPGPESSFPGGFVDLDGTAYFVSWDPRRGDQLWRSDGTPEGTSRVTDFAWGSEHWLNRLFVSSGRLYVSVTVAGAFPAASSARLYVSDGSRDGLRLLHEWSPCRSMVPGEFTAVGDRIFFTADQALWRTDGTAEGTARVAEFARPDSYFRYPIPLGDRLIYFDLTADGGSAVWSVTGDSPPVQLASAADWTLRPAGVFALGPRLVFLSGHVQPVALWASDGTAAGTMPIAGPWPGGATLLASAGGKGYFAARTEAHGREVWITDGTPASTRLVADAAPGPEDGALGLVGVAGDLLYFVGPGYRLWRSDGSEAGTARVQPAAGEPDFYVGDARATALGDQLLFTAYDEQNRGLNLWRAPRAGDAAIVARLRGWLASSEPGELVAAASRVFFRSHGDNPWPDESRLFVTDGTAPGTWEIHPEPFVEPLRPLNLTAGGPGVFFLASGAVWSSDGTSPGTRPVSALEPATVEHFAVAGETLFYSTSYTLLASDGTPEGARVVLDLGVAGGTIRDLTGLAESVIVEVDRLSMTGSEPWISDGTAAGTVPLGDLRPGVESSYAAGFVADGRGAFFSAQDDAAGREPWHTDGTAPGTVRLADIRPGTESSSPEPGAMLDGLYLFAADDGVHGRELWASDGTTPGTRLLLDLNPGAAPSSPAGFTRHAGAVYFSADDGEHGFELWRTDGTAAGTVLIADLAPGPADGMPEALASAGGLLYFAASTPATGEELWSSDGTAAGTRLVFDLEPGPASSGPRELTPTGDLLLFSAATTATGRELFSTRLPHPLPRRLERSPANPPSGANAAPESCDGGEPKAPGPAEHRSRPNAVNSGQRPGRLAIEPLADER